MVLESFKALSGCLVPLSPFDINMISYSVEIASWVIFGVCIYQYFQKQREVAPEPFKGYGATFSGTVRPDIILYGVTGKIEDIVEGAKEAGFLIFNALALNVGTEVVTEKVREKGDYKDVEKTVERDLHVICLGVSPALLIKLSTIYSKTKCPSDLTEVEPRERIRLVQKAVKVLENSTRFKYIRAEYVHEGTNDYFDLPKRKEKTQFLNSYFGFEMSIFVSWLNFMETSLAPMVVAWMATVFLGSSWFEPMLGILFAVVISITISRWRVRITNFGKESGPPLRDADDPRNVEMTELLDKPSMKSQNYYIAGTTCVLLLVLAAQYYLAYILEVVKNKVASIVVSRTFLLDAAVEVIYWFASQVLLGTLDGLLIPQLVKLEGLKISEDAHASRVWKSAFCRVGVFAVKLCLLVRLGYSHIRIQEQISVLFILHCFITVVGFRNDVASIELRTEKKVNKKKTKAEEDSELLDDAIKNKRASFRKMDLQEQGVGEETVKRLKSKRSEMYIELEEAAEAGRAKEKGQEADAVEEHWRQREKDCLYMIHRLGADDNLVLDELVLHQFEKDPLLLDVISILGIAQVIVSFVPMAIPGALLCVWRVYDGAVEKLFCSTRRCVVKDSKSMDPWLSIIEVLSVGAVVINTFVLYYFITSPSPRPSAEYADADGDGFCDIDASNVANTLAQMLGMAGRGKREVALWLVLVEHLLLFVCGVLIPFAVQTNHGHYQQAVNAVQHLAEFTENSVFRLRRLHEISKFGRGAEDKKAGETDAGQSQYEARLKMAEIHQNIGVTTSPYVFLAFTLLPYGCSGVLGLPWYCSAIPLFLMCAYYSSRVDSLRKKAAYDMVGDPGIFKFILKHMPAFVHDTDLERSEWVNKGMHYSWPSLKKFGEEKGLKGILPGLKKAKPPFLSKLELTKLTMGTIPPRFHGIKVLDGNPALYGKEVQLDMEMTWSSNMEMVITYGIGPVNYTVGVSNFFFAGKMRIHCINPVVKIPPFALGKVTFFEKPTVDFSLNFGKSDIMDVGGPGLSVSAAIQAALKKAMQMKALYPKWINVPLVTTAPLYVEPKIVVVPPEGVIVVKVVSCADLIIGDITSSDPYVKVRVDEEVQETEVIQKNLNPEWADAVFNFLVKDKGEDCVHFEVWDKDFASEGTFLGEADVFLKDLHERVPQRFCLALAGVEHGSIDLEITFISIYEPAALEKENADKEVKNFQLADILVDEPTLDDELLKGMGMKVDNSGREAEGDVNPLNSAPAGDATGAQSPGQTNGSGSRAPSRMSLVRGRTSSQGSEKERERPRSGTHLAPLGRQSMVSTKAINVSGVLTVSAIVISRIHTVKTMMSSANTVATYISFSLGRVKRSTLPKREEVKLSESHHFVVEDVDRDQLKLKIKKDSGLGIHTVMATFHYRVSDLFKKYNHMQETIVDVSKDNPQICGSIKFHLHFRPAKGFKHT